ncbi:carbonic anhydrase [Paraburkholderia sp. WC7.3d]
MKAVFSRNAKLKSPNLDKWLCHANNAAFRLEQEGPLDDSLKAHDQLSQLNVLVQLEHLMTYPIVRQQVTAGALVLSGWWFDIATGAMYAYERTSRSFAVIDRTMADRMVARLAARAR